MRTRSIGAGLTAALMVLALSGCQVTGCAGADQQPPHVDFKASEWRALHPGATLMACLAKDDCANVDTAAQLLAHETVGEQETYMLDVMARQNGQELLAIHRAIRIPVSTESTACGPVRQQGINVTLGWGGRLEIH